MESKVMEGWVVKDTVTGKYLCTEFDSEVFASDFPYDIFSKGSVDRFIAAHKACDPQVVSIAVLEEGEGWYLKNGIHLDALEAVRVEIKEVPGG